MAFFGARFIEFNILAPWWIGIVLAASWILANKPFGNWIYASDTDANAAHSADVPVARVKVILFMLSSLGAALVGILQTVQYRRGDVTYGSDFVFAAPVAVVIGGVLLTGAYDTTLGILLGTIIYGIVNLGVFYTGWNSDWVELVLGVLLLAVVSNDCFRRLAMSGG
mgnify:CR=1 FL=1